MVVSMKVVFISADIEGVADLVSFAEAGNDNPQLYTRGMEQMSREVWRGVPRGQSLRGAEINYSPKMPMEGGMNIFHEYLPERAQLIRGEMRSPYSMIGNIGGSYDAVIFVRVSRRDRAGRKPMAQRSQLNGHQRNYHQWCACRGIPPVLLMRQWDLASQRR